DRTIILYESPHRLLKTLDEFIEHTGPDRQASVSRELTKLFEETVRGTLLEIKSHFENNTLKGEFVICIAGAGKPIKG
ncbi:MAG: 16S rRNA (cytidine(1402)-2'-O)-methyltransferase, partial [Pedobacter sp.]